MLKLYLKETRQLLPIGALWLVVVALNYIVQFFTERFDEQTFGGWCEGYCDYNSSATVVIFTALIALVTAYSLFPREHDDATIDFLRALPVSRSSLFIGKVLAAWMLLCLINVLSYALDAIILSFNPESIGGRFYPQVWGTLLWRDCLVAFHHSLARRPAVMVSHRRAHRVWHLSSASHVGRKCPWRIGQLERVFTSLQ